MPAHASWLLIHLAKADWTLLASNEHAFIDHFLVSTNQSILRNLLVTLLEFPLTDYREGEVLDALIAHLKNEEDKVALRVYSLYKLAEFVQRYPEIKTEIDAVLELIQVNPMSPAMKVGIRNFEKNAESSSRLVGENHFLIRNAHSWTPNSWFCTKSNGDNHIDFCSSW